MSQATVTGTVRFHDTYEGTNSAGKPYVKHKYKLDNDVQLETFAAKFAQQIQEGQTYTFVYEPQQRGEYVNNKIVNVVGGPEQPGATVQVEDVTKGAYVAATTTPPAATVTRSYQDNRGATIDWWASLKAALETFKIAGIDPVVEQEDLYILAKAYRDKKDEEV